MRRAVLCAVAAGLVPVAAGAQSVQLSELTESAALARLSPDSARVRAARAGVDVAKADVLAAARWPNPRFTVDRESVAGATEYLTMVSQVLPTSGRRKLESDAASELVQATSSRADDLVRRLRADLRLAYADLWAAQVRERELRAGHDRLRELAGVLARREAAGDAAGYDQLRAERERLDVQADLALAATDRRRAQAALGAFFSGADTSLLVAVPEPRPSTSLPSVDELMARVETTRGDLVALQHDQQAAALARRAADRRRLPEPEIVAGTKSSTIGTGDIGTVVMVHATLPLFDRSRPERALALARASQARAQADALRVVLRGQIESARIAVDGHRQAADRYRDEAVRTSDEIARIAQVAYDAGERSIVELLDAYRVATAARVRQAALDLAVRQAEVELAFSAGWELP